MDIAYVQYLTDTIKLKPTQPELSGALHQNMLCMLCGEYITVTPKSKVSNYKKYNLSGCPTCSKTQLHTITHTTNIDKLKLKFEIITDLTKVIFSNNLLLRVKNKSCGHIFNSKTGNLLNRDVNCPTCNKEIKRVRLLRNSAEQAALSDSNKEGWELYQQQVARATNKTYRKHKITINPHNLPRALANSKNHGFHLDHIVPTSYGFKNEIPVEIISHHENLRMISCRDNVKKHSKLPATYPSIFGNYIQDKPFIDSFIADVTKHLNCEIKSDYFNQIIVNDIAINLYPLQTNLEKVVNSKKKMIKHLNENSSKNLRSVFVFGDEWILKKELVLKKIQHICKLNSTSRIIHARKCTLKQLTLKEKNSFLNQFHIQGTCVSQYNYGAFYNDELIAVMTFCKPRIMLGQKNNPEGQFELSRFASNSNYICSGIASRLLKYFQTNNPQCTSIFSFADRRYSVGNMYSKLGFKLTVINPSEYFYVVDHVRKHRWGFRKHAIKDKFPEVYNHELTEYAMMLTLGYDRIWDCGTLKYEIMCNMVSI